MGLGACFLACLGLQSAAADEPASIPADSPFEVPAQMPPHALPEDAAPPAPEAALSEELSPPEEAEPPPAWRVAAGEGRVTVLLTTRGYLAPLARHHIITFPAVRGGGSLEEGHCDFSVEVDTTVMRVDDTQDRIRHGLPGNIGPRQRSRVERRVRDVVLRSSDHGPISFTATRCHDAMGTFEGVLTITDQLSPIHGRAGMTPNPSPRLVATTTVRLDSYDLPSASRWLGLILPEPALPVVIELPLKEG